MILKKGLIIIFVLILINLVSASFGIGSDYFQGAPLRIEPGESRDIVFGMLQNTDTKEVILKAEMIEGGEIASITDSSLEYAVPAGTTSDNAVPVNIRVDVPGGVNEGSEYNIKIRFLDISPSEGEGTVTIAQSLTKVVPVLVTREVVGEEDKEGKEGKEDSGLFSKGAGKKISGLGLLMLLLLVVGMGVVVFFIIKRKNKTSFKKVK